MSHPSKRGNSVPKRKVKALATTNPILPGATEVGCGYNVLNGDYANPNSCNVRLFDLDKGM